MIKEGEKACPNCGGGLRKYDKVKRIVKGKNGGKSITYLQRWQCKKCKIVHREIPDYIIPYKQYDSNIVYGVKEDLINENVLGFEDYPCSITMKRWQREKNK